MMRSLSQADAPSFFRITGLFRITGRFGIFALVLMSISGCELQTRADQDEKQVMQKQVQTLQKTHADGSQRFTDIDEELRRTNGRIEVSETTLQRLDQKVDRNDAALEAKIRDLQDKMNAYREAIAKLEQGLSDAQTQIQTLAEAQKRAPVSAPTSSKSGGAYATAEELFDKKDWKSAIPEYERYRKQSPNGKNWRDATYKIGVSFQELGMADEAKAFYDELIAKGTGSPEAKKAQYRLKAMKKK